MLISRSIVLYILIWFISVLSCHGQQRPLITERARTIENGHFLFDIGIEFFKNTTIPFSGLKGDMTRAGVIAARFGFGSRVEVQMFGTVHQFLNISEQFAAPGSRDLKFSGNSTSDYGDITLATKIRLTKEVQGQPVLGFRFGVELPNSSNWKGLGTDETNVFGEILLEKNFNRINLISSAGLAILGDPVDAGSQDDLFIYGLGAIIEASPRLNIVAEINGRTGKPAAKSEFVWPLIPEVPLYTPVKAVGAASQARLRVGIQLEAHGMVWDLGSFWGLRDTDPSFGIIFGVSKDFQF